MNLIVGYEKSTQKQEPVAKKVDKPVTQQPIAEAPKNTEPTAIPSKKAEAPKTAPVAKADNNAPGGFFKSAYNSSDKRSEEKGVAAVFKSTSGWDDGKYYCLHNTAPANSIVKITNTANNKVVYAKVLDVIPNLKQNEKISIQLSNAAANALGAAEENFECIINY
ncbi:MAG TPA: hypothetical protein PLU18_09685 [Ferruginibacter sp.]|nr:hypothetical protein [Ferruginibacter sp.]